MIGVTSAEAYILLNNEEMELGLEPESRNKLVSDLVTATYQYHQKEIFSAIITEYTDWANPAKHPVTTRSCGNNLVNTYFSFLPPVFYFCITCTKKNEKA